MSGQPWYRHSPRDFLDGIVGMTPDLIGAYIVTLDLIYARGGPIPNDARWLSGTMGCSTRAASSLVDRLVQRGKLHLVDGLLSNVRAENEMENSAKLARTAAETGANGGRVRAENAAKANNIKGDDQGAPYQKREEKKREEKKEDSASALSARTPERLDAASIAAEWNAMAKGAGLPLVTGLSDPRRKAIAARLADNGRERLTEAISKIGASEFCCASKWCGFDWMLKPANLLKVLEGNYDGNANHGNSGRMGRGHQPPRGGYRPDPAFDGLKRLHAEFAAGGGLEALEGY